MATILALETGWFLLVQDCLVHLRAWPISRGNPTCTNIPSGETLPSRTCWLDGCAWDRHGQEWMDQTPELGVGRAQGLSRYAVNPTFPAQHVRSASSCSRAVGLCRRAGRTKRHACSYHTFLFKCALIASIQMSWQAHLARPPAWY